MVGECADLSTWFSARLVPGGHKYKATAPASSSKPVFTCFTGGDDGLRESS